MHFVSDARNQPKTASDAKDVAETEEVVKVLCLSVLFYNSPGNSSVFAH